MRSLPELLAPAGSPEALSAAVSAGADAVYLSGKRFGARKYAANFDEAALEKAIGYAHERNVKVYVTVNTLIRDDELRDVARYLSWLYSVGADAVLVQDIGVAAMAREVAPDLHIHASTQMTIHNSQGAAFAAGMGMKRAVLAREVSLKEARDIARHARIDLEVFIHGALCYCYSGQCLLSSVIGGRSGNRGMCAQPCRKPYVLLRGEKDSYGRPASLSAAQTKERFLMSTRDLSVYEHLDKIVKAPIASLKIEGRMKSAEYVAIVVDVYRRALDAIAGGKWSPSPEEIRDLALAFNRDFTEGYLLESKKVMGREMSDKRGIAIGTVSAYDARHEEAAIRLAGCSGPDQGDGLVFISPGEEVGMVVHRTPVIRDGLLRLKVPQRVRPGTQVRITSSTALTRKAEGIIARTKAHVPVDLVMTWDGGTPLVHARLSGPRGPISLDMRAAFRMENALSRPLTSEQIEAQIRKTGGTPFTIGRMEIHYPGDLFAPVGALNQLRRDLLSQVESALIQAYRPDPGRAEKATARAEEMDLAVPARAAVPDGHGSPDLAVYADSLEVVKGAVQGGCRRIYFEPRLRRESKGALGRDYAELLVSVLDQARAMCSDSVLVWKWPKITRNDFLNFAVPLLSRAAVDGVMVESPGAAEAAAKSGLKLYGSVGLNIWNHLAVWKLDRFQVLTVSPELSADQISALITRAREGVIPSMELLVQGNLEVAVAEDCLPCAAFKDVFKPETFFGLQDFKRLFPLRLDDDGRTHILNAAETCLVDHMKRLLGTGLDSISIDARGRTELYARDMVQIYRRSIDMARAGCSEDDLVKLKEDARAISLGGITTGHFIKGLRDELPDME
ncbi:MAG TPA: U32 family peptidase [Methanotrichaceae archaeon]|nr:U32 family peptidase [Methanotrichaceae archaeon]